MDGESTSLTTRLAAIWPRAPHMKSTPPDPASPDPNIKDRHEPDPCQPARLPRARGGRHGPAWEQFANGVLGLQPNGGAADGTRFLKMDENHHRLALHPGPRDDIAYAGWAIPDEASLRALAEQLASHGGRVSWGTPAEAIARRVTGLLRVQDPSGVINEVCWGPQVETERPSVHPARCGGFEAGGPRLRPHRARGGRLRGEPALLPRRPRPADQRLHRARHGPAGRTTVAFLHSGPRHHSLAIAQFAAPKRLHHFMLQLRHLRRRGHDLRSVPGPAHTDRDPAWAATPTTCMTSFYIVTPSGFQVEYGHGGRGDRRRGLGGAAAPRGEPVGASLADGDATARRAEAGLRPPARGRGRAHAAGRRNQLTSSTAAATDSASTIQVVITLREALSRNRRRWVGQYEGGLNMGWCCRRESIR